MSQTVCHRCWEQLESATKLKKRIKFTETFIWDNSALADDDDDPDKEVPAEIELHCHACGQVFDGFYSLLEHISSEHVQDLHLGSCSLCSMLIYQDPEEEVPESEVLKVEQQHHHDLWQHDEVAATTEESESVVKLVELTDEENHQDVQPLDEYTVPEGDDFLFLLEEEDENETEECIIEEPDTDEAPKPKRAKTLFDCPNCTKSYTRKNKLREHWLAKHNGEMPPEVVCSEPIIVANNDPDGMGQTVANPFNCHLCDKSYSRKDKLKHHLCNHHHVTSVPRQSIHAEFQCPTCGKTYRSQDNYDKHLREHFPTPFQCFICRAEFAMRKDWRQHESQCIATTTMGNGEYKCLECQGVQSDLDTFRMHLKSGCSLLDEQSGAEECPTCKEVFPTASQLTLHQEVEHEQGVKCATCGNVFESRAALKKHAVRMHKGYFSCPVCGQKLSRADKLAEHMRLHTGFVCCETVYSTRAEYMAHRKWMHPTHAVGGSGKE